MQIVLFADALLTGKVDPVPNPGFFRLPADECQDAGPAQEWFRGLPVNPASQRQKPDSPGQFMGRCALVSSGVMQNQILKMHKVSVECHGGACVEQVRAAAHAVVQIGGAPQPFVRARQQTAGAIERLGHPGPIQ